MSEHVLVVGAGPSGLMVAHELARHGLSVSIVDRLLQPSPYSRAIGVQVRTCEIFDCLGLGQALNQHAHTASRFELYDEGTLRATFDCLRWCSDIGMPRIVDQKVTEQILTDALKKKGIEVRRGVTLLKAKDEGHAVTVSLESGAHMWNEQYQYVIGCDGAHSTVRKHMPVQFRGFPYPEEFILADVMVEQGKPMDAFRLFLSKQGIFGLIPMDDKKHARLLTVRRRSLAVGQSPTIDEFRALAKRLVPYEIEFGEPSWISRFYVQCRSASAYSFGRLFLVGDAAHIHSPAGGQGMNTGLQDAHNLAWKLAMVAQKRAHDSLLDTYHAERHPVGQFLLQKTDRLFRLMVEGRWPVRLFRQFLLPSLVAFPSVQRKVCLLLSQTRIRYRQGFVHPKTWSKPFQGPEPGQRMPNLVLFDERQCMVPLHNLCKPCQLQLFLFIPQNHLDKCMDGLKKDVIDVQATFSNTLHVSLISLDQIPQIFRQFPCFTASVKGTFLQKMGQKPLAYLIRPDHYVAMVSRPFQKIAIKNWLRHFICEKQVPHE